MPQNIPEEIGDLISLSRMINTEAHETNRMWSGINENQRPKLVDPKKVLAGIDVNKLSPPTIAAPVPVAPPVAATMGPNGELITISAPKPFLSLPEGYTPRPETPPIIQSVLPPPLPSRFPPPLPSPAPTKPVVDPTAPQQMEMVLPFDKREEYKNILDYFDDKLKIMDARYESINAKLNELLSKKRGPYGKRTLEK